MTGEVKIVNALSRGRKIPVYVGSPLYYWLKYIHEELEKRKKTGSKKPIPLRGNLSYIHEKLLSFLVGEEDGVKIYEICGVTFKAVEDYTAFPSRLLLTPVKGEWICKEI